MTPLFISDRLRERWSDPVRATYENSETIKQKPLLSLWYQKIYTFMKENRAPGSHNLEIGSATSHLREHIPDVQTSNILNLQGVDLNCSAYDLPVGTGSLDNLFLVSVFHHLSDPLRFLKEAGRVLRVGGRVLISDPLVSWFSWVFWVKLHPEHCDTRVLGFDDPVTPNPLVDANSANLTILFEREKEIYLRQIYPLKLEFLQYHSKFHYWIAGGFNFPQFLPAFCAPLIDAAEWFFSPLDRYLASFAFVVLTKEGES